MKTNPIIILTFLIFISPLKSQDNDIKIRIPVDTVGFATKAWQMDSLMNLMKSLQKDSLKILPANNYEPWKMVISPHDDYTYVGFEYPALLSKLISRLIIFFGVCHKAKQFNLEDKIIFDSYTHWQEPYGNVPVSSLRNEIIRKLPKDIYVIHDSVQAAEHSVEAIIPFLQYYNRNIEIISILVPFMPFSRMNEIAKPLANAINDITNERKLVWGRDYAIAISSDAVHYGDQGWGERNFAFLGSDSAGYEKAVIHENEIISNCLSDKITPDKVKKFINYTTLENNYKEYKWTWCGRYSIPLGLMTAYYLENLLNINLSGEKVEYSTSISHSPIPVKNLGMGITAPANIHHWVGYPAIGYK